MIEAARGIEYGVSQEYIPIRLEGKIIGTLDTNELQAKLTGLYTKLKYSANENNGGLKALEFVQAWLKEDKTQKYTLLKLMEEDNVTELVLGPEDKAGIRLIVLAYTSDLHKEHITIHDSMTNLAILPGDFVEEEGMFALKGVSTKYRSAAMLHQWMLIGMGQLTHRWEKSEPLLEAERE